MGRLHDTWLERAEAGAERAIAAYEEHAMQLQNDAMYGLSGSPLEVGKHAVLAFRKGAMLRLEEILTPESQLEELFARRGQEVM